MTNQPIKANDVPELTGQIIDIFEDFLASKNVCLHEGESEHSIAVINGSDYDLLNEQITALLQNWDIIPERS